MDVKNGRSANDINRFVTMLITDITWGLMDSKQLSNKYAYSTRNGKIDLSQNISLRFFSGFFKLVKKTQ